jgi:hypothetical protein
MWATKIIKVLRKKKKPFAYLPYLLVSHASSIKCFENRLIFDPQVSENEFCTALQVVLLIFAKRVWSGFWRWFSFQSLLGITC